MGLRPMPRQKLEVSGLPSFYRFAINIERIVFAAITTEKPLDERLFIYRKCKNLRFLPESDTVSLLKSRLMCYNISGDENEEIRDNH